jgi:hypothetical protein
METAKISVFEIVFFSLLSATLWITHMCITQLTETVSTLQALISAGKRR